MQIQIKYCIKNIHFIYIEDIRFLKLLMTIIHSLSRHIAVLNKKHQIVIGLNGAPVIDSLEILYKNLKLHL